MLTIKSLPTSLAIQETRAAFRSLIALLGNMKELAEGPDSSTSLDLPAKRLSPLFADDEQAKVLLVNLPAHAEPHLKTLLSSPVGLQTYGVHLAQRHVCLSFGSKDSQAVLRVDVQHLRDVLGRVRTGQASLVLAVACGNILRLRLLDEDLRETHADDALGSRLQAVFSFADNYEPRQEYAVEELETSFKQFQTRCALPEDLSVVNFCPRPLE
jgi:hypothetical protein